MTDESNTVLTDDPVYRHALREAFVILALWGTSFAWTVPYCYTHGYTREDGTVETVLGIPAWVWWGVALPWIVMGVIAILLCLVFIQDDDLGHTADEEGATS